MKQALLPLVPLLLALGCGGADRDAYASETAKKPATTTTPGATGTATKPATTPPATTATPGAKPPGTTGAAADNTGINDRDRKGETLTPPDQLENKADLALVEKVREALMKDDSLSMNAKNVKVVVQQGVVTLRGPVASQAEKSSVEAKAKSVTGVVRVDNQLDVEGS
jgi:hypothetical protein